MSTLLIIEPDADSHALLKEITEDHGYTVMATEMIENGLEIINRGIAIACVLISVDGGSAALDESIARLRETTRGAALPVIAVTSSSRTSEGPQALKAGCAAFVPKPITDGALLDALATVLATKG